MTNYKKKSVKSAPKSAQSVVARSDDGTLQIILTIPFSEIERARSIAIEELARDIDVPGFRKGHAPKEKVIARISENTLLEKTLNLILPDLYLKSLKENSIKPAVYPKFELVKTAEGENWQVRATTCELPKIELGNYKKDIKDALKATSIWTPDKAKAEDKKVPTPAEKEQKVIEMLLKKIDLKVPKILIDREVDARLADLLSRLEKLGLTLESYLASIRKSAEELRKQYEDQARQSISLELILEKIAEEEKIVIDDKEVDKAVEAASANPDLKDKLNTSEQRNLIKNVLKRRASLDSLTSLL